MATNVRCMEKISVKQHKLIEALLAGNTIVTSAKIAGCSEKTAHVWLKQPAFQDAYQNAKQSTFENELSAIRSGISLAIETLRRNMTEAKPYVQVQAASKWLDIAIELYKSQELEERLKELEDAIRDMQR